MASLADLKKKSQDLDALRDKVKNDKGGQGNQDNANEWRPHFDKERGTAFAKIRFLPAPPGEDDPFVKVYSHGFKGPQGKWYINNSLSSLGKPDPVGEMNSRLWNSGVESDKEVARKHKRKTSYYANVLVLEDPANPENVGKVFIYKYGPVVQKFIEDAIDPEFEDEVRFNPFDPFNGRPFTIRMRTQDDYVKYDKSSWGESSPIADSDDEIERIWNSCHSLSTYFSDENFKTYDELKNQLFNVLGPRIGQGPDGEGIMVVEGLDLPPEPKKETKNPKPAPKEDEDLPWDNGEKESSAEDTGDLDIAALFDD